MVTPWCLSTVVILTLSNPVLRPDAQKTSMNRDHSSTWLILGKLGQGMKCCKCNSNSNVLVVEPKGKACIWYIKRSIRVNPSHLYIIKGSHHDPLPLECYNTVENTERLLFGWPPRHLKDKLLQFSLLSLEKFPVLCRHFKVLGSAFKEYISNSRD